MLNVRSARELVKEKVGSIYGENLNYINENVMAAAKQGKLEVTFKLPTKLSFELINLLEDRLKELGFTSSLKSDGSESSVNWK